MAKMLKDESIRYVKDLRRGLSDQFRFQDDNSLRAIDHLPKEKSLNDWDLFFVCADGIVSAHRLVISNASKYIMHMLDDQPHWHPTYIHVLDLPKSIVQILVDLAYTGEMRFVEELQGDVIDAMHTLGWVHTDCLSADYDGDDAYQGEFPKSPPKEDRRLSAGDESPPKLNFSSAIKDKVGMKSPSGLARHVDRVSFNEEDESMEISHLPDVDWSDMDDSTLEKTPKKAGTKPNKDLKTKKQSKTPPSTGGKANAKTPLLNTETIDENVKPAHLQEKSGSKPVGRRDSRRASFSETNTASSDNGITITNTLTTDILDASSSETNSKGKPKKQERTITTEGRKTSTMKDGVALMDETSQVSNISSSSSIMDSPGKRVRRKPKRFEEFEEEKPKPRSPSKPVPIATKSKVTLPNQNSDKDEPTRKEPKTSDSSIEEVDFVCNTTKGDDTKANNVNKSNKTPAKSAAKKKISGENPRSSLITSYFAKRGSDKGDDSANTTNHGDAGPNIPSGLSRKNSEDVVEMLPPDAHEGTLTTDKQKPKRGRPSKAPKNDTSKGPALDTANKGQIRTRNKNPQSSIPVSNVDIPDPNEVAEVDSDSDNSVSVDSEKSEGKKRSFDDIRSSYIGDNDKVEEKSMEVQVVEPSVPVAEVAVAKPERKSLRKSYKALSVESGDLQNDGEDADLPKRKRSKVESPEEALQNDTETGTPIPPRRASKQ